MDILYSGDNANLLVDNLTLSGKSSNELTISPTASGSLIITGFRTSYQAATIDTELSLSDSGKTISNDGAGATVTITLPDASGSPGVYFNFVRVSTNQVRINPPDTASIIYSGGTMSLGEYLALNSDGAKLQVISASNGNYIATTEFGTLAEETP